MGDDQNHGVCAIVDHHQLAHLASVIVQRELFYLMLVHLVSG